MRTRRVPTTEMECILGAQSICISLSLREHLLKIRAYVVYSNLWHINTAAATVEIRYAYIHTNEVSAGKDAT